MHNPFKGTHKTDRDYFWGGPDTGITRQRLKSTDVPQRYCDFSSRPP